MTIMAQSLIILRSGNKNRQALILFIPQIIVSMTFWKQGGIVIILLLVGMMAEEKNMVKLFQNCSILISEVIRKWKQKSEKNNSCTAIAFVL